MMRRLVTCAIGVLIVASLGAQQSAPDLILFNGKIITVDERFTIAQAVAVRGNQIAAVGTTQDITRLAGPATRRIDLRSRSVIPGLIDNHMHLLRYGTTWKYEVRWDGVECRKEALEMLRARAQKREAGRLDLHPGWLGDGAVRRRPEAVHTGGAGPGRAEPPGVPAGLGLRGLPQ